MLGFCSNCGQQIMDLTKKGQDRLLINYRDHMVELNNGTLMRIGVCQNCKELLVAGNDVMKVAKKILDNHKNFWDNDEHAPVGYEKFDIADPNTDEEKFMAKRNIKIDDEEKALQKQKDDFKKNHAIEMKRQKDEKKKIEQKQKDFDELNINLEL